MDFNADLVQKHYQTAYNFALYKLGNSSQAEDVASQTINLLLLKSDFVMSEDTNSWVRKTCLNYCRKIFTGESKDHSIKKGLKDDLIDFYQAEHDGSLTENFRHTMMDLNELETRSLVLYFNCGQNIKKMADITGENQASLRKRIYRIKMKLKAETYKKLGYIATKKIIIPQMHEAIIQFVRRLKKNIDNNSIEKMFYYFSETNTANYKPQFDIQKVKDYEVILKNGKFKIYLFYSDSEKQINTVSFSFYINEKNQLKISELPKQKRKIVKLNKNKNSEAYQELNQLLKDYPENRQGLIKIPSDIMRRLAKEV